MGTQYNRFKVLLFLGLTVSIILMILLSCINKVVILSNARQQNFTNTIELSKGNEKYILNLAKSNIFQISIPTKIPEKIHSNYTKRDSKTKLTITKIQIINVFNKKLIVLNVSIDSWVTEIINLSKDVDVNVNYTFTSIDRSIWRDLFSCFTVGIVFGLLIIILGGILIILHNIIPSNENYLSQYRVSDTKDHYSNNFDLIRFLAACFVIISHSVPLTGNGTLYFAVILNIS